ncbi:hypothetical protein [Amycolatopsis sp. CA-230715]|uniref:hypothetical protein n=1 Tax=Amycolatopsis sp. CA-230715 TaxID=2745196 RepID=UPI001C035759|nr:hypothetical protein [Amycolatopsis sp. CA-230715]QWF84513.1 hypothetical protein HUW46_07963 [Amycolatopsis sp. CA-230715]
MLATIAETGAIRPYRDPFDPRLGKTEAVCTASARMYARVDADLRRYRGEPLSYRHGESGFMIAWSRKFNRSLRPGESGRVFTEGSDNHPALFGIKLGAFEQMPLSRMFARHERRSAPPVAFAAVTHVEVPAEHVAATEELFAAHELPGDSAGTRRAALFAVLLLPFRFGHSPGRARPLSSPSASGLRRGRRTRCR